MPILYGEQWANQIAQERERQRLENEAKAKKSRFNIGTLLPALIAAPFTGGASLVSMGVPAALGEGVRAATGSDIDLGALASAAYNMYGPTTSARVDTSTMVPNSYDTFKETGKLATEVPNKNLIGDIGAWLQDAAVAPKSKAQIAMDALKATMSPEGFTDPTTQIKYGVKTPELAAEKFKNYDIVAISDKNDIPDAATRAKLAGTFPQEYQGKIYYLKSKKFDPAMMGAIISAMGGNQ